MFRNPVAEHSAMITLPDTMKKHILFILLITALVSASAQFLPDTNKTIKPLAHYNLNAMGEVTDLSYFDGSWHLCIGGMPHTIISNDNGIIDVAVDSTLDFVGQKVLSITQNPATKDLYFTRKNEKCLSQLYQAVPSRNGRHSIRNVKFKTFKKEISTPTFSADGMVMVFASRDDNNQGRSNLWYSEFREERWQEPAIFAKGINTRASETNPHFVGRFLLFSSNNNSDRPHLFATRIKRETVATEAGERTTINATNTTRLTPPFNSNDGDWGLCSDESGVVQYWIHTTDTSTTIYASQGRMDCIAVEGGVSDYGESYRKITNAKIAVALAATPEETLFSCEVDAFGRYRIFLQPEVEYSVTFSAPTYSDNTRLLRFSRKSEESLIDQQNYDIELQPAVVDIEHHFSERELFGSDVSVDLCPDVEGKLRTLVQNLKESPTVGVTIVTTKTTGNNPNFNNMINSIRLQTLQDFLVKRGIAESRITKKSLTESESFSDGDGISFKLGYKK